MDLAQQRCVPCRSGEGRLSAAEIAALAPAVSEWKCDGDTLHRNWKFKNFAGALAFVQRVGAVAETENHHPDIAFGWGHASLVLSTHAAGGLTRNDFILAAKIDGLRSD